MTEADAKASGRHLLQRRAHGAEEAKTFFARWVPIGVTIGVFVGTIVAVLQIVIFEIAWEEARNLYLTHPWLMFVLLPTGFLFSAVMVRGLTPGRYSHGTEEVLNAYHTPGKQMRTLPYLRRTAGSLATIGPGGSAGLEGAAIMSGSWFASFLVRRMRFLRLEEEERKVLLLVGAAAGVAAIFRAPFTGLLFSLELPYKGDVAKNAFVPGLLASASSYLTYATIIGPEPIFQFDVALDLKLPDLPWTLVIGLACGIMAWLFVKANHGVRALFRHPKVPWEIGAICGGLIVATIGYASLGYFSEFNRPLALGPGYDTAASLFRGDFVFIALVILLLMKTGTTLFTLGTYGVGGIFFQSFLIGGLVGAVLHAAVNLAGLSTAPPALFVTAGMASFLAASYKTPIAATAFVAEGTASADYIIPAFVASAVAYIVSGTTSISDMQRNPVRVRYDVLQGLTAQDAMQTGVVTVPASLSLEKFLNDWVPRYRHVAYPVTNDGGLVGWITLEHASAFPPEARALATVQDAMSKTIPSARTDESLLEVLRRMQQGGTSRMVVIDEKSATKLVGILAEADLLRLVELRSNVQPE